MIGSGCIRHKESIITEQLLFHTPFRVITENDDLANRLRAMRFFGFAEENKKPTSETIAGLRMHSDEDPTIGTNAKMTEIHAALGICSLDNLDYIIESRKKISEIYYSGLSVFDDLEFGNFESDEFIGNNIYFPIIFSNEDLLLKCLKRLNEAEIFPRRYFYPPLTAVEGYESDECPISKDFSSRVLCLPMSPLMSEEEADKVVKIVLEFS